MKVYVRLMAPWHINGCDKLHVDKFKNSVQFNLIVNFAHHSLIYPLHRWFIVCVIPWNCVKSIVRCIFWCSGNLSDFFYRTFIKMYLFKSFFALNIVTYVISNCIFLSSLKHFKLFMHLQKQVIPSNQFLGSYSKQPLLFHLFCWGIII